MKRTYLLSLIAIFFLYFSKLYTQPANDNACDALEIILDSPAVVVSNIGATAQAGEQVIAPPSSNNCVPRSWCSTPPSGNDYVPGSWCDSSGSAINHSLWFKFTAPISTAVKIGLCGSTFNTQLALYRTSDCADFSSYTFIWATDNQQDCGSNSYSSTIRMECLEAGAEYMVLVDDWQDGVGNPVDSGTIEIFISREIKIDSGVSFLGTICYADPKCPGGSDGYIDIALISGVEPISYIWSNGATTQDIYNLSAGTYEVTVSDFCGTSAMTSASIEDLILPLPAIVFDDYPQEVIPPVRCGSGARGGQISPRIIEGVGPFSYEWSNGSSKAFLSDLEDGEYILTVSDFCGDQQEVRSYYLGMTAGPDIEAFCFSNDPPLIGIDNSSQGGEVLAFSCNTDQSAFPIATCISNGKISPTAHWKTFDLVNDFGVTTEVNIDGIEVFVRSLPDYNIAVGVPVKVSLYIVSTALLDDSNLQLILLDSVEFTVPEILVFTPFLIPLKVASLGPTDILALKIETLFDAADGHIFELGANNTPTNRPTYMTSVDCNIIAPTALPNLGFDDYLIMTIFSKVASDGLTYEWEGPVDNSNSPTPGALGMEYMTTYTVTITNVACGITVVDEVVVTCLIDGTENLLEKSFTISPNPGNSHFQLWNKGDRDQVRIVVYDLQGKLVFSEFVFAGSGASEIFDLSVLAKGLYLVKLETAEGAEVHRLVVN